MNQLYKPRIFRSCLFLIGISLSTTGLLIAILGRSVYVTNDFEQNERLQNTFLTKLNQIYSDLNACNGYLSARLAGYDQQLFTERSQAAKNKLDKDLLELEKATKEKRRRIQVRNLQALISQEQELIKSSKISAMTGARVSNSDEMAFSRVLLAVGKDRRDIQKILTDEWQRLRKQQDAEDKVRDSLNIVLLVSLCLTIAIALGLWFAWARLLRARVSVVMKNSNGIRAGEQEFVHLDGDDEFAYFNSVLNQTIVQLREAEEYQKSIIAMVAHDLRSPIMSAHIYIDLLITASEDICGVVDGRLESCSANLNFVLRYVNELLEQQKSIGQIGANTTNDCEVSNSISIDSEFEAAPRRGLSIFQKSLIVSGIPLILQLCFLLYVQFELHESEQLLKKERLIGEILMQSSLAELNLIRGSIFQGIYLFTSQDEFHSLSNKCYERTNEHLTSLQNLCKDDSAWTRFVLLSKQASAKRIDDLSKLKPGEPVSTIAQAFTQAGEMTKSSAEGQETRQSEAQLFQRDTARLSAMGDQQNHITQGLLSTFFLITILDFGLAISILTLMYSDIVKRLNLLIENATKLTGKGVERHRVGGGDELARLDELLFRARERVDALAFERQAFAKTIMQEIGKPLSQTLALLKICEEELAATLEDNGKKQFQQTQAIIKRILHLLDDLLLIQSISVGRIELDQAKTELRGIVDDAVAVVANLAAAKEMIITNACESLVLTVDGNRLVQLLVNYLSNAIKFSAEKTEITVRSHLRNDRVRIEVLDYGPGMHADTAAQIFEKNFQAETKQKSQGFGLGLTICKLIADSHSGAVGVETELGKGSTFWVEVPI